MAFSCKGGNAQDQFNNNMLSYLKNGFEKTKGLIHYAEHFKLSPDGKYIILQLYIKNSRTLFLYDIKSNVIVKGYYGDYDDCRHPIFNTEGNKIIVHTSYDRKNGAVITEFNIFGSNKIEHTSSYQSMDYPVYLSNNILYYAWDSNNYKYKYIYKYDVINKSNYQFIIVPIEGITERLFRKTSG